MSLNFLSATPCSPIPTIVNGRVDTTSSSIPVNGEVPVVCDDQYKPSHTDVSICVTNGTYRPALPTCNGESFVVFSSVGLLVPQFTFCRFQ